MVKLMSSDKTTRVYEKWTFNYFQLPTWISGFWNRTSSLVPTNIKGVFGTCWRSSGTQDSWTCTNDLTSSMEKHTRKTSLLMYDITRTFEKSSLKKDVNATIFKRAGFLLYMLFFIIIYFFCCHSGNVINQIYIFNNWNSLICINF